MYAIEKNRLRINDVSLDVFGRKIADPAARVEVEAGTTGYTDCDSREGGGRTYFAVNCRKGDFLVSPLRNEKGRITGFEISGCGDAALDALFRALDFARKALDDRRYEVKD